MAAETEDIAWFTPGGEPMTEEDWRQGYAKSLGVFLNGATIPNPNPRGEPVTDDDFYLMFNAHYEPLVFVVPTTQRSGSWIVELDTETGWTDQNSSLEAGDEIQVQARSLVVMRHPK